MGHYGCIDIIQTPSYGESVAARTEVVQLRVTAGQKAALKRLAGKAGVSLSGYLLLRALPREEERFSELLHDLTDEEDRSYALAELNDLLTALLPAQFLDTVRHARLDGLSPVVCNYVAALVEQAAGLKGVAPPAWTSRVTPLPRPYFAAPLKSLRLHLLIAAPVPFKRRNLFVDSGIGKRV